MDRSFFFVVVFSFHFILRNTQTFIFSHISLFHSSITQSVYGFDKYFSIFTQFAMVLQNCNLTCDIPFRLDVLFSFSLLIDVYNLVQLKSSHSC